MAPLPSTSLLPPVDSGSDDDENDWEEVDTTEAPPQPMHIEITLQKAPKAKGTQDASKKAAMSHAKRMARIYCHKIHTVALLANASKRNKWINDPLLHARLLSLTPMSLQNSFAQIRPSTIPDSAHRGRRFEAAVTRLAEWWSGAFFDVEPAGHIRSRSFDDVAESIKDLDDDQFTEFIEAGCPDSDGEADDEVIRSEKSLMKHALMRSGSRDVSAQLFTALCRGLGIPARLVVSLQSVPWKAGIGKPKPRYVKKKGKGKEPEPEPELSGSEDDDDDMEEVVIPNVDVKGKGKAKDSFPGEGERVDGSSTKSKKAKGKEKEKAPPVVNLRKSRNQGQRLGSAPTPRRRKKREDPLNTAPVFWTEVFSRADARWLPVDPIRIIVNRRKAFDPTPAPLAATQPSALYTSLNPGAVDRPKQSPRPSNPENRMVYVVAFEEDGYARDVTPRYAREYGAKVAKVQGTGKGRKEWWEEVLNIVRRPYRLHRDDVEDEEMQNHQLTEAMPTSIAGFKDHPLYVLPRHLKRDEVVRPPVVELGKFRGEPVYARGSVVQLKSAETWMRSGRIVREGEQPMKWVKMRAGTVRGLRAIEVAKESALDVAGEGEGQGGAEVTQGMYAATQTQPYVPPPIVDGIIPKNDFGNIDLYVPSMLPEGAAHVPFKGVAKIARKLGFDFAEAVTGFEFKKRRAFPILEGVVVAAENEGALVEAYWEAEQDAEEKARAKRKERVIKRWQRLIHGLRIRQRLQDQYAGDGAHNVKGVRADEDAEAVQDEEAPPVPGGFITGADDVVQAFHLPKNMHTLPPELRLPAPSTSAKHDNEAVAEAEPDATTTFQLETLDDDQDGDEAEYRDTDIEMKSGAEPRTLQELAENIAQDEQVDLNSNSALVASSAPPLLIRSPQVTPPPTRTRKTRAAQANGSAVNGSSPNPSTTNGSRSSTRRRTSTRALAVKTAADSDVSASEPESKPTPSKRRRTTAVATPPATDRVLRTRSSKSAAKIEEEREAERAYRRAIAQ